MGRKPSAPRLKDRTEEVVDAIYFAVKARQGTTKTLFPALKKRITDLVNEVKDADQVELVCLTILDDSHEFSAWKDFNWVYFEMIRDSLEVPDGAWKYALWSYRTKDAKIQESVNYWLGKWFDGVLDRDMEEIVAAQSGLENLWLKYNTVGEIKW